MENITAYKTSDGKIFENLCDAQKHDQELHNLKIWKEKEDYVREKLKTSVYGDLFYDKYAARKSSVTPDIPLVYTLIKDTELVKEIIGHLENIQ